MTLAHVGVGRLVGGRYVLEAPIGRGGMGEVWRARHVALASAVAIKFLHAASAESESSRRRFLTEAQVTANLRSRHAVQVFDFGVTEDGLPYLVMELLEGETLDQRIAQHGRLSVEVTARVLQKAARALARAHQLGIVHRDFKPENIMLVADDEEGSEGGEHVKVVDFGVAKLIGALDETLRSALTSAALGGGERSPASFSVSSTGLGTPYYMAPEQVSGASTIGPAADVWAFGVVAYECLTGRRPFGGSTVGDLLLRVLTATPPAPASRDGVVPEAFDAWFAVACARDPARRYRDISTAVAALLTALSLPASRALDLTPSPFSKRGPEAPPPPSREPPSRASLPTRTAPRRRMPVMVAAAMSAAVASLSLHDGPPPDEADAPAIAVRAAIAGEAGIDHDPPRDAVGAAIPAVDPEPTPSAAPAPADAPPVEVPAPPRRSRPTAPVSSSRRLPPLGL